MYSVSVIIPVLNDEFYLERLLKKLEDQKNVNLEIIVADADSKDSSISIAEKHKVKLVKGGIPAVGRNQGFKSAKHNRILFLDADVNFGEYFIYNCLNQMESRGLEVASVFSIPESRKYLDRTLFFLWDLWIWSTQKIFPHAPGYCIFSSKRVHKKIKGFREDLFLGEDSNYVLRASKISRFGILNKAIRASVRRLRTEGRCNMAGKMVLCGIYRIFNGEPKKNIFKYYYNNHKNG